MSLSCSHASVPLFNISLCQFVSISGFISWTERIPLPSVQVLLISKDRLVGHSFLGFSTNARVSSTAMADGARDPASGKDETEFIASEQVTFSCDECYVYEVRGTVAERSLRDRGETSRGKWTERLTFHLRTRSTYVRTFSHQIPPKRTAMGHRAEQWNVERWIREVRLKVVSQGAACRVVLVDKESDELFAVAPIPPGISIDVVVEPVLDSSRYYVLRVEDTSEGRTRHAFIGIGFRHRPHSSDFSAALYEHRRFLQKKAEAEKRTEAWEVQEQRSPVDYSIHGSITVNVKNTTVPTRKLSDTKTKDVFQTLGGSLDIPPPPRPTSTTAPASASMEEEDLDFGDFVSS